MIARIVFGIFLTVFIPSMLMAAQLEKPTIGISGSSASSKSVTAMMVMVRTLGAEPVLLSDHENRMSGTNDLDALVIDDHKRVDAIIIMGNNDDINPARYGQTPHPKTKIETNKAREEYEFALIQHAIDQQTPLLGICGGHQRINVLAGGTLHQHVPDLVGNESHMQKGVAPFIPVQRVNITGGTTLDAITNQLGGLYTPTHEKLPENVAMVNSFHHQAIDRLAKGFRVNAMSGDGIIEGIEPDPAGPYKDQFILGVQWHPEFAASPVGPKIVEALIKETQRSQSGS